MAFLLFFRGRAGLAPGPGGKSAPVAGQRARGALGHHPECARCSKARVVDPRLGDAHAEASKWSVGRSSFELSLPCWVHGARGGREPPEQLSHSG